jgi:hypothetical protein
LTRTSLPCLGNWLAGLRRPSTIAMAMAKVRSVTGHTTWLAAPSGSQGRDRFTTLSHSLVSCNERIDGKGILFRKSLGNDAHVHLAQIFGSPFQDRCTLVLQLSRVSCKPRCVVKYGRPPTSRARPNLLCFGVNLAIVAKLTRS